MIVDLNNHFLYVVVVLVRHVAKVAIQERTFFGCQPFQPDAGAWYQPTSQQICERFGGCRFLVCGPLFALCSGPKTASNYISGRTPGMNIWTSEGLSMRMPCEPSNIISRNGSAITTLEPSGMASAAVRASHTPGKL